MTPFMSHDADSPRFSLIIPAYNEEGYLPRLLDTVDAARAQYRHGADAVEVIVADNASTDGTAKIAEERGCRVAYVEKRMIAASRNGGASVARGRIFGFIDADSQIHPDTFNAIEDALATGKYVGGATGVKLERMSLGIAVAYAIMVPMVWAIGMDTGVVFCLGEDFRAIGGYMEDRLFAEDVQFMLDLRKLGRSRRQKLARVTSVKAVTSTRKWDKHGEWHYLMLIPRGMLSVMFRRSDDDFAKKYWYDGKR
jgi:glycosyltransferase involved in cell wall biosynthesis